MLLLFWHVVWASENEDYVRAPENVVMKMPKDWRSCSYLAVEKITTDFKFSLHTAWKKVLDKTACIASLTFTHREKERDREREEGRWLFYSFCTLGLKFNGTFLHTFTCAGGISGFVVFSVSCSILNSGLRHVNSVLYI